MICPNCGAEVPDGSNQCTSCGAFLNVQYQGMPNYDAQYQGTPNYDGQYQGMQNNMQYQGTPNYDVQYQGTPNYDGQYQGMPSYDAQYQGVPNNMQYQSAPAKKKNRIDYWYYIRCCSSGINYRALCCFPWKRKA